MRSFVSRLTPTLLIPAVLLGSCLLPLDEYWYRLESENRTTNYDHVSAAAEDGSLQVYLAVPHDPYSSGGSFVRWDMSGSVIEISDYYSGVVLDLIPTRTGVLAVMNDFDSTIIEEVDGWYSSERTYSATSSVISIDRYSQDGFSSDRVLLSPESSGDSHRVLAESGGWSSVSSRVYAQRSAFAVFAKNRGRVYHLKPLDEQGTTPIWYYAVDPGTDSLGDAVELTWTGTSGLGGPLLLSPDENTLIAGNVVFDVSTGLDFLATLSSDPGRLAFVDTDDDTSVLVNVTATPLTEFAPDRSVTSGELQVWVGDWTSGEFVTVIDLGIEPVDVGPSDGGLLVVGPKLIDGGTTDRVQIHRVPGVMIQAVAEGAR